MPRRDASSVGADVLARAARLSDALLAKEVRAFGRNEASFIGPVATARARQDAAFRRGIGSARALDEGTAAVARQMAHAIDGTVPAFELLLKESGGLARVSITQELRLVESTLASKYRGLTRAAMSLLDDDAVESLAVDAVLTYQQALAASATWFVEQLRTEWRTAATMREAIELVDRRLFSTQPVALPGHSGVGLWWKVLQVADRTAREGSISHVNAVRTAAMSWFNRLGEER